MGGNTVVPLDLLWHLIMFLIQTMFSISSSPRLDLQRQSPSMHQATEATYALPYIVCAFSPCAGRPMVASTASAAS